MAKMNLYVLTVAVLTMLLIKSCLGLECYVCHNQEDNVEKCLNTIKTCEQDEDVCLTEIAWSSTPYWSQGAIKQYYISKRCSSKDKCKRLQKANMPLCTYIWYEDWKCSDCCKGDRCNYYVISASTKPQTGAAMLIGIFISLRRIFY